MSDPALPARTASLDRDELAALLADCANEPIHIPGSIQPHGCLIVCSLPDWTISHLSANFSAFFDRNLEATLGAALASLFSDKLVHDLRNVLQTALASGTSERKTDVDVGSTLGQVDVTVHAVEEGSSLSAILEIVPRAGADTGTSDPITLVKGMIGRFKRATTLDRFLQLAAAQVRAVTGYDRVMIYKFLEDGSGEVVAEACRSGVESYRGLRYPESDIPAQARALYRRQWLRLIPDAAYRPVPIVRAAQAQDKPIDLSLSSLRSVSPIHIEYLHNMGVAGTLTVSIMRGDSLWGLIACHHLAPRRVSGETCAAAELFGQIFSIQLESREAREDDAYVLEARAAHDRLMIAMSGERTIFESLAEFAVTLKTIVPSDGIGLWRDGAFTSVGAAPPPDAMDEIVSFLAAPPAPFSTNELAAHLPAASAYAGDVSGLLALPLGPGGRNYLFFFRSELPRTVQWGGDPAKAALIDPASGRISPRNSFAVWTETVRGQSRPWRLAEIQAAETLRVGLLEVVLRRADLMDRERRRAAESQAVLIAELNHRVKNVLALIRSLVRQSRLASGKSIADFSEDLESRIKALGNAHDQLTGTGWSKAPLRRLLAAEAEAFIGPVGARRVLLEGPPVLLDARAYQTLALVFHELMTNAAKYGALSSSTGRVSIRWFVAENGALTIDWSESGGPRVAPPRRRGFGSTVIEQSIPFELAGQASVEARPSGLTAHFVVPGTHIALPDPGIEEEAPAALLAPEPASLAALKRLLLVEDSMMIALDAQAMLTDTGVGSVEIAGSVADARRLLAAERFDAAILDINLAGETSFPLADALEQAGQAYVFATGYSERVVIPDRFAAVPLVTKPYDRAGLADALAVAAARTGG